MIRGAIGHTPARHGISLQFLGAVGTVTGSQFSVRTSSAAVLVDCGMFRGSPEEVSRNRIPFLRGRAGRAAADPCAPGPLRARPGLVRAGYHGPIFATSATADLSEIVLRDAGCRRRQARRSQAPRGGRRWRRAAVGGGRGRGGAADDEALPERIRKAPPEGRTMTRAALYDERDVDQTVRQFRGVRYGAMTEVAPACAPPSTTRGTSGSAIIELRVTDGDATSTIVSDPPQRHADRGGSTR